MSAGEPLYWWDTTRIAHTSTPNINPCPQCGGPTCPHCGKALPAKPVEFSGPIWIVPPYTYPAPLPSMYPPYVVNQGSTTIAGLPDGVTVTYSESE